MTALIHVHLAAGKALEVFKKCRDCTGTYKEHARHVRTLSNILQDIEDAIVSHQLGRSQQDELDAILLDSSGVVGDLDVLLDTYNDFPVAARMTWDRLQWGQTDGSDMATRLQASITLVSNFYDHLKNDPQAQIERALEQLADEISKGRHETASVGSLSTIATYDDVDDDSGWEQVIRDLGNHGIQESVVKEYRVFIVDWILRAINSGVWSTEKIPVGPGEGWMIPGERVRTPPPLSPPPLPPKIPSPSSDAMALLPPPTDSYSPRHLQHDDRPPLRPEVSREVLQWDRPPSFDEPPSPIEQMPETNILWTAQQIVHHWNRHEWNLARKYLEEQIQAVERGEFVDICGVPVQPDIRILRHLLGVCYSFAGDFLLAKEFFESVLQGVYVQGLPMDDGDIAAARWLGQTCIIINQSRNAAFALSLAIHGLILRAPLTSSNSGTRALDELRYLNDKTSALREIKSAFENSNRDVTSILQNMAGTAKFQIVLTASDQLRAVMGSGVQTLNRTPQSTSLAEGFLIQPLVSQTAWPFSQDPFFQYWSSISLLAILSRPKSNFIESAVTSVGLGASKGLTYVTKQPLKWLIEAVRYALNTYAIEWKIQSATYLLRLSQTHDNIAYYDCFAIKFRKLSFRSVYGVKITESQYSTRSFQSARMSINESGQNTLSLHQPESQRKEIVRTELAGRLKDYLEQAEKDVIAGKPWPPTEPPVLRAPYEMGEASLVRPVEMAGREGAASVELDARTLDRSKYRHELPNMEIAELPG
ncbi:hypothetical protein E6O75_ATG03844 [Venturia nashicola]|uniref:Uncharacterized protein n=1 Tax=Venturia nashicola TaxID=86259 RepID=A0A4Z1PJM5_9PEZI|nr:hypothetical protein E6O75_ATG03844 [Venturia nashicola]